MFESMKQLVNLLGWKEISALIFVTGLFSVGMFSIIGHIVMIRISILFCYIGLYLLWKLNKKPEKVSLD